MRARDYVPLEERKEEELAKYLVLENSNQTIPKENAGAEDKDQAEKSSKLL